MIISVFTLISFFLLGLAATNRVTDKVEKLEEIICDAMNDLEALAVNVKHRIAEIEQASTVREESFNILTWQPKKGAKLADFETYQDAIYRQVRKAEP